MKTLISIRRFFAIALGTAVIALATAGAPSQAFAQHTPFAGLAGVWSGAGTIAFTDGSKERIKCRASYAVGDGGNGLQLTLRCASDSYRFELSSDVHNSGGRIAGTWAEATRNINGNLEGRARDGVFEVLVSSAAFNANLAMTTRGNSQSVRITTQSNEFAGVSITLSKS